MSLFTNTTTMDVSRSAHSLFLRPLSPLRSSRFPFFPTTPSLNSSGTVFFLISSLSSICLSSDEKSVFRARTVLNKELRKRKLHRDGSSPLADEKNTSASSQRKQESYRNTSEVGPHQLCRVVTYDKVHAAATTSAVSQGIAYCIPIGLLQCIPSEKQISEAVC
ncbi:hypothetical protein BC939DRAFT_261785 [Gamsiella multidivaricata]|uniref:uncharacterized protein n=1 Tax=Gamsiella multidivaricata TaxID=101098 RepID=UPI00221ED677|nr:uncharacterized protein BC939DRAFT_261785 [Gamsiella multidivaricata]KAI7819478.1 hypothetical protein BC939DRAFT_261785 [Gamsiella multidivaricata]